MVQFKDSYDARIISKNFSYLEYDRLKEELHKVESGKLSLQYFRGSFEANLQKVESCFLCQLSELDVLLEDVQCFAKEYNLTHDVKWKRKAQEAALKRNATAIYDKVARLEAFCLLNKTAAIKLLKKQDKLDIGGEFGVNSVFDQGMDYLEEYEFANGMKLLAIKFQVELTYAAAFCGGVVEEAKGKLLVTKMHKDPKIPLEVTFKVGIILTLIARLIGAFIAAPRLSLLYLTTDDPTIFVYAAVGALVMYRWLWGFCVYMWDSVGIDYILILDLDANKHMPSSTEIFSDAGDLTILYLVNVTAFHSLRLQYAHDVASDSAVTSNLSQYAYVMPILLIVGTFFRAMYSLCQATSYGVFSFRTFRYLFSTPYYPLELRHNYAANILCSFTKVFSAFLYSGCYFASGSFLYCADPRDLTMIDTFATVCSNSSSVKLAKVVIYLIPNFIRFLQCLRQRRDFLSKKRKTETTTHQTVACSGLSNNADLEELTNGEVFLCNSRARSLMNCSADSDAASVGSEVALQAQDDDDSESSSDVPVNAFDVDSDSEPELLGGNVSAHAFSSFADLVIGHTQSNKVESAPLFFGNQHICNWFRSLCNMSTLTNMLTSIWVWPYSYNALRYFMKLCVIIFGSYPPQDPYSVGYMKWYIPLHIVSTMYSCYWDVANDFQLMQQINSDKPFLREIILYKDSQYFYYVVLVLNPVLRFFWSLSFTPYGTHPFLVLFEIIRRSMWSCLRMELVYIQELARRK